MLDSKFWEKYFKVYDVLNDLIPYQELMEDLVSNLDVKRQDLILDAGSGTGNLSMRIEKMGGSVVALDFSEEGQKRHRQKNPERTKFLLADLTKPLPFPDNHFDKIASNNTLYTIPKEKREQVVQEFYRVLKPGGKVVISNPTKNFKPVAIYFDHIKKDIKRNGIVSAVFKIFKFISPTGRMFFYNNKIKKEDRTGDYDFFTISEKKEILKKAGFVKISENISVYSNQGVLNYAYK
jgi:ubiquinone/menaquinone biosynthesis C-methylase UbiE